MEINRNSKLRESADLHELMNCGMFMIPYVETVEIRSEAECKIHEVKGVPYVV